MFRMLMMTIIAVVCVVTSVFAENWVIQTVDNEGDIGYLTKSWYDSQGHPNVIYRAAGNSGSDGLYHSRWTGAGWLRQTVPATGWPINSLDMVQRSPDQIAVSMATNAGVLYSVWNGAAWTTTHTGAYGPGYVTLVFDANARPHIFTNGFWHLFLDSNSVWQNVAIVGFGDQDGANLDVAMDSQGRIYIVYRTTAGKLKMAYYNGTVWGTEYIEDSSANVGAYCRVILDDSDVPHIVYYDATNTQLKYATWQTSPKTSKQSGR